METFATPANFLSETAVFLVERGFLPLEKERPTISRSERTWTSKGVETRPRGKGGEAGKEKSDAVGGEGG